MRLYGLIGKSLAHSFSPKYFKEKFEKEGITGAYYNLYPLENIDEFNQLISDFSDLSGLNVTIPYKSEVIPFLDKLDLSAQEIGAVNTIKFSVEAGKLKLYGYNTDYLGFWDSIKSLLSVHHQKALILGTGGSSKAVAYAFKQAGIDFKFVSRNTIDNNILSYTDLNKDIFNQYKVIVNTTPLGMFPNLDDCPNIPYKALTSDHILFDLIYNPELTLFLKNGIRYGAQVKNGLEMLQLQAEYAWEIWNK